MDSFRHRLSKSIEPEIGGVLPIRVSFIAKGLIPVQLADYDPKFGTLQEKLQSRFGHLDYSITEIPIFPRGSLVAARYAQDDNWYRAVVLEQKPDRSMVHIKFVDFGESAWMITLDMVQPLPMEFVTGFPAFVVTCRLAEFDVQWHTENADKVSELIQNNMPLFAKFGPKDDNEIYPTIFYTGTKDNLININEYFVNLTCQSPDSEPLSCQDLSGQTGTLSLDHFADESNVLVNVYDNSVSLDGSNYGPSPTPPIVPFPVLSQNIAPGYEVADGQMSTEEALKLASWGKESRARPVSSERAMEQEEIKESNILSDSEDVIETSQFSQLVTAAHQFVTASIPGVAFSHPIVSYSSCNEEGVSARVVTAVGAEKFFVHLVKDEQQINQVVDRCHQLTVDAASPHLLPPVRRGTRCVAYDDERFAWRRAEVISYQPDKQMLKVLMVDFGTVSECPFDKVRQLVDDPFVVKTPISAIPCALAGVADHQDRNGISIEWPERQIQTFVEMVNRSQLFFYDKRADGTYVVDCQLSNNRILSDYCLNLSWVRIREGADNEKYEPPQPVFTERELEKMAGRSRNVEQVEIHRSGSDSQESSVC